MPTKIYLYIIKKFLAVFVLVSASIFILIAAINLFELLNRISGKEISFWQAILLDTLQVPSFIEDISSFLVMLSAMITLFSFSIRSEIIIMRASGLSLWHILSPISLGAFLLGIFFVLAVNPSTIVAEKKFISMEQRLIEKEKIDSLSPIGGFWIRQQNLLNADEDIIIRANKIYRTNLQMTNVSLWFFDGDQKFYQKIDAKSMSLNEGYWLLEKPIINNAHKINHKGLDLKIPTNLKAEFISKKILNNFENVRFFSVYDLPVLIKELKGSGFSPRKFVSYHNSLLAKPFLFVAMALMAAFFSINNIRSKNNIIFFVTGVSIGLVCYITLIIVSALGSSGIIPTFLANWMTVIILLSISLLLILKKEVIN